MRGHKRRLTAAVAIAVVLLVPAIIWSGMQQSGVKAHEGISKMPDVNTVGPEMTPYVMTAQERAKRTLPAQSTTVLDEPLRAVEPRSTIGSSGPYPGMTQAELDKLANWRATLQDADLMSPTPPGKPTSTVIHVPRPPGIEGLTPQERAKLESCLKDQNR